ncbi:hypothetical protein ACIQOW_18760 [Kitasatospora sp. NPDC091335]|uniref:hypothetical protein n=1 Tax=Kitasatospora sp. NPDC091335 TaxID=3364085 RepID=UPI003802CDA0
MDAVTALDPGRFVQHPAGHDSDLRIAVEELQQGRWMSAHTLLARSWDNWPVWTARTQVLAAVSARTNVLHHWQAEAPDSTGLVTLLARTAVDRAVAAVTQRADQRTIAQLLEQARHLCWDAASTLPKDPVPWICLLSLAQLDPGQSHPVHRIPAPDHMLPPGPWGLLAQARRSDPWNREAFHRMLRFWLAREDSGTAGTFLATFVPAAPAGSPLYALPLYLMVDSYRRAQRKDAAALQWTNNERGRSTVLQAYENWRAAPREPGLRWPVVDEGHLAHALWAIRRPADAAEVLVAMAPFVSSQPWTSVGGRPDDLFRQVLAQSAAAAR